MCAKIEFEMLNPLIASLPEPLVVPLDSLPALAPTLQLLWKEQLLPERKINDSNT